MTTMWYPIRADTIGDSIMSRVFRIVPFALFRPLWCQQLHGQPEGGFSVKTCSIDGCERAVRSRTWCEMHYGRWKTHGDPLKSLMPIPAAERFWPKVRKTDTCWLWEGAISPDGYGSFYGGNRRNCKPHRFAYEEMVGPIPEGLVLDHLCRVRHCVNPAHLEPVTERENALRGVSPNVKAFLSGVCRRGHELTADNSIVKPNGARQCRTCVKARANERYAKSVHRLESGVTA